MRFVIIVVEQTLLFLYNILKESEEQNISR